MWVGVAVLIALAMIGAQAVAKETPDDGSLPQATNVSLGEPGLSFRYVETFGVTEQAYIADTQHLNHPNGVFIDHSDNLYVVEEHGARMLKYRTSDGASLLSIGTAGLQNRGEYTFDHPLDVAVDGSDNIWVVDRHRVAQYDASGDLLQEFPPDNPWESGTDNAHFDEPRGIAFDGDGRLYVSDYGNHRIQVYSVTVDSSLVYSTTIGETGVSGSDSSHFNGPSQIAFDSNGRFYVADVDNARVQRCTYSSGWTCSTFHGTGTMGSGPDQLRWAHGIGVDGSDRVYITDNFNARVKRCQPDGSCSIFASGGDLEWPTSVALDSSGDVYVSDFYDYTILKFQSNGSYVGTFVGTHGLPYQTDDAHFNGPYGVDVDSSGNIYVGTHSGLRAIKLDAEGNPAWSVGTPGVFGDTDQQFGNSWAGVGDVAAASDGTVYVADRGNERIQIFNADGGYVSTLGERGDGPYEFSHPEGVFIDDAGTLYVADTWNHRVQIYDRYRVYQATLGVTGVSGSDNAHFNDPTGVAVGPGGTIYVADKGNARIQVFDSARNYLRTIGSGRIEEPQDVAVDAQGKVYVADIYNQRVQVFDADGDYLTTIGGEWGSGPGQLRHAAGVAVDNSGYVYVADEINSRIQKFAPGVPGWRQVNINGFGKNDNVAVNALASFNDTLYAGTLNFDTGAEIWRKGSSWTPVTTAGLGASYNVGIDHLIEFDGNLYAGTWADATHGGEVWRYDGANWTRVVDGGFDDTNNAEVFRFAIFGGTLYASTSNENDAGEIWYSSSGDAGGWNNANVPWDADNLGALALDVFNGYLYAGTANWESGGEMWRTPDGTTWSQVNTEGFGDDDNDFIASFGAFNGSLYVGTRHANTGGQVWRCSTCDGSDWSQVISDGFGNPDNRGVYALTGFNAQLYSVTCNEETGIEVWRTDDGATWEQVGPDGLGDSNNDRPYWDNSTLVFEDNLYVGTQNWANGGEVWQTLRQVYLPLVVQNF